MVFSPGYLGIHPARLLLTPVDSSYCPADPNGLPRTYLTQVHTVIFVNNTE